MVGRAKYDVDKANTAKKIYNTLMARAIVAYKAEQKKPMKSRCGLRTISTDISAIHFSETGNVIKLSHVTLKRLADGGLSREKANEARAWLLPAEVDVVIDFIIEIAHRGFPLSHRRLKEHIDTICRTSSQNQVLESIGLTVFPKAMLSASKFPDLGPWRTNEDVL
jgi:hypothetical protein